MGHEVSPCCENETIELTPDMIVGVSHMKKTEHALEWKRPPSHDRSKQEEKIVDVEGDLYVCPSMLVSRVRIEAIEVVYPVFEMVTKPFDTILASGVQAPVRWRFTAT